MNKAVPWRIKGVDFDARSAAADAAQRAGLSLGEWLNAVIAEQAAEDGVEEDDFSPDDRLDAVRKRLASLRDGKPDRARARQRRDDRRPPRRDREHGGGRDERFRAEVDAEALLESAIAAFDRRASRSSERTARALADVADLIDTSQRERQRDDAALATIADRLSQIERKVERTAEAAPVRPVEDALARLERQIDALARRPEPAPARRARPAAEDESDDEIEPPPRRPAPRRAAYAEPAPRYAEPAPRYVEPAPRYAEPAPRYVEPAPRYADVAPRVDAASRPPEPARRPLSAAIAEVARRQRQLDGAPAPVEPPRAAPPLAVAMPSPLEERMLALIERMERSAAAPRAEIPRAEPSRVDLAGLQGDIASLASRLDRMRTPDLTGIQSNISTLNERIERLRPPDLTGIQSNISTLNERIERLRPPDLTGIQSNISTLNDRIERLRAPDLTGLQRNISTLNERIEGLRAPDLSGLQGGITQLTERVERMRAEIAASRNEPRDGGQIEQIRREVSAMARAVADLAPRASIHALQDAVTGLAARIADSRSDGVGEAVLAPIDGLADDLRAMLRDFDPRQSIAALEREIRAIGAKLDAAGDSRVADPALARGIAEQTREVRDILARVLANQNPSEKIERSLADLAARVEMIATRGADADERGDLAHRVGEIRAMIADPFSQERTLQILEKRLEAITDHIDGVFGERLATMQRELAAELGEARTRTTQLSVDQIMADVGQRIDAAVGQGLEAMEKTLSRAIERAPRDDARTAVLEDMVRDLAARVEANAATPLDDGSLDALHQQIERLARQFDRTDRTADTLVALERSVGNLFARLDQSQQAAVGAAEAAARAAAAEALREAPALEHPELTREIADLRTQQDASDHRTHATLSAVHETLERVVERLSLLEDDIADVRQPASAPAPAPRAEPAIAFPSPAAVATARDAGAGLAARIEELRRAAPEEPARRPAPAFAAEADDLIEPGAALGGWRAEPVHAAREPEEPRAQASFIEAARRAARSAATAAADARETAPTPRRAAAGGASVAPLDQARAYYESRKRPILLSLAALMVIFGAWQIAKVAVDERPPSSAPVVDAKPAAPKPAAQKPADLAAPEAPSAPAPAPAAAQPQPQQRSTLPTLALPPKVEPAAPPADPAAGRKAEAPAAAIDRTPVASIERAEPTAESNGAVRALALGGDPAAQYELATRYADGKLLARDLKLASQWFEKAAGKGLAPAAYRLGAMYERGLGVARDPLQAKAWYQRAADQGNVRAMHNLAVVYADGADGKPDYANALTWFRRASEFGVRDSQYNLAILYARGLGTTANLAESWMWFSAAAAQGDEDAAKKRDDVGGRLPAADLARAKALAASFQPKTPNPAANEVSPPPGGWDAAAPARPEAKPGRPKVSML